MRSKVSSRPARRFDAAGGAALGVAGLLVAAWACGLAISSAAVPYASPGVRESSILGLVDRAIPVSPSTVRRAFGDVVDSGGFPQVVAPWEACPAGLVRRIGFRGDDFSGRSPPPPFIFLRTTATISSVTTGRGLASWTKNRSRTKNR